MKLLIIILIIVVMVFVIVGCEDNTISQQSANQQPFSSGGCAVVSEDGSGNINNLPIDIEM